METTNIVDFARRGMTDAQTESLRTRAQDLIALALEAEFANHTWHNFKILRTGESHTAVVRNGHHPELPFQTSIGPMSARIPKVRLKDDRPVTFRSSLVLHYVRRTKMLEAALAFALSQRHIQWEDEGGPQGSAKPQKSWSEGAKLAIVDGTMGL